MSLLYCDLDDCVADFTSTCRRVLSEWDSGDPETDAIARKAAYTTWTQWRTLSDMVPFLDDVIAKCHSREYLDQTNPLPYASDILSRIYVYDNDITYISNRDPDTRGATCRWLLRHHFPLANRVICTTDDKMNHLSDADYLIDDRPRTLVDFVNKYDRKAFGIMTPANQNLTDVRNIYLAPNWSLLERYLREKTDLYG